MTSLTLKQQESLAFNFASLLSNSQRFIVYVKICQYICIYLSLQIHMKYDYNMKFPRMSCGNDPFTSLLYHTHRHIHKFVSSGFYLQSYFPISLCALVPQSNGMVLRSTFMYLRLSHLWIFRADLECMLLKPSHFSCI